MKYYKDFAYLRQGKADTAKTFHALPDRKSIFYNFFQF